ncbi:Ig-like domain-containing protein, partial [Ideonella oryzae]
FTPVEGSNTVYVRQTDAAGNVSAVSTAYTFTLDTAAPTQAVSGLDISADTGASATDFITKTASQTITGTLSGALASGEVLYGSVDNGAHWTDITSKVSGTAISWDGAALSGSSTILFKISDAAGNDSATSGNQAYVLDTAAPVQTVSGVDISADTGASATDFITKTASQTITGTLSGALAVGDILYGSVDNGAHWTDITSKLSGTAIHWDGATLSGSSAILFKITDAAGNDSATTGSQAYTLDTTAPSVPSAPDLVSASDSGISTTDNLTNDTTPTLGGTAEANSTVHVFDGATELGAVTADGSGNWSFTTGTLAGGTHSFTATATDAAGNDSAASSALSVSIDTTAPTLSSSSPADNATGVSASGNITLNFSEAVDQGTGNFVLHDITANSDTTISVGSSEVTGWGTSTLTINPTSDLTGGHSYAVHVDNTAVTDAAGNAYAGINDNTTVNFDVASSVNTSIVVFDLYSGVSSSHSNRTFQAGVSYTIYIRVDSNSATLLTDGSANNEHGETGTWGNWRGGQNLGSDDKIVLVGSGSPVLYAVGRSVNHFSLTSGPSGYMLNWKNANSAAASLRISTNIVMLHRETHGGHFANVTNLWSQPNHPASHINNGAALSAVYLTKMPTNVLHTQGLA